MTMGCYSHITSHGSLCKNCSANLDIFESVGVLHKVKNKNCVGVYVIWQEKVVPNWQEKVVPNCGSYFWQGNVVPNFGSVFYKEIMCSIRTFDNQNELARKFGPKFWFDFT